LDEPTGEEQPRSQWEKLAEERPSPEEVFRNSELTTLLRKCTALLSPTLRRTFQLRVVDDLSILETARILGVPHGTVKAQLTRARTQIARHMRAMLAPSRWRYQRLHKQLDLLMRTDNPVPAALRPVQTAKFTQ
jgi:RNA polymerase sigma-70 factor (ECF subfamily)